MSLSPPIILWAHPHTFHLNTLSLSLSIILSLTCTYWMRRDTQLYLLLLCCVLPLKMYLQKFWNNFWQNSLELSLSLSRWFVKHSVWLDWAVFERSWYQIFLQKYPKYWVTFRGYFEKCHFKIKMHWRWLLEKLAYFLFQHLDTLEACYLPTYMDNNVVDEWIFEIRLPMQHFIRMN